MEKILKLYTYVDGGINDTPFPNSDNPIEIGAFRYDAKRMGGAPTITASVDYPSCLDNEWTDNVYAEFNGEKYYLKQIPTSSYDNADVMYRHEVTLVSERVILDNVYFFDVVTGNPSESDKPVSNSTKVTFFGGIRDFASRLNASLEYSGLDYEVVVDDEITTEEKLMSFEDQFFSNVLQAIYNTYEVPYYFDGKTIHIGYAKSDVIVPDLSYGVDNALLSITKNNANYKTVNRATGYGSSENIPFYYPNNAPKGQLDVTVETTSDDFSVRIKDYEKFSDEMKIGDVFSFISNNVNITNGTSESSVEFTTAGTLQTSSYRFESLVLKDEFVIDCRFPCRRVLKFIPTNSLEYTAYGENYMNNSIMETIRQPITYAFHYGVARLTNIGTKQIDIKKIGELEFEVDLSKGTNTLSLALEFKAGYHNFLPIDDVHELNIEGECLWEMTVEGEDSAWRFGDDTINLEDYGLVATGTPSDGDTIAQNLVKYVNTSKNLMPSIYRQSDAKERFYNAINYPFTFVDGYELNYGEYVSNGQVHNDAYKDDEGNYIRFDYPYVEGKAKEHIVAVEDLMPTIKEAVNSMGLRMDMFSEFAYDDDDSDETEENEDGSDRDFVHSYFFAKLRKLDFNLFDCAIEQQPMTVSFTSGNCGACSFEIGVTEEFPQKNPVLVNSDGTLKRDANGRVICGQFEPINEDDIQDRQQDTINNEVWIALKKEEQTYGELMPKAPVNGVGGHRPKACSAGLNDGDTFVILGINLPEEYVTRQERQLEKDIIKYIKDNNEEKFTFSIGFSRIYFAENENILKNLSENSKVRIFYNNLPYDLYVSSFSYNLQEGDVLPDIKVELDETLKIGQNPIQRAVNQVKSELGNALRNIDVVGAGTPYFLRKDVDDEVLGRVNFRKGVKFGEGGKVEVLDNNSAKLTIEYLEVTKKASFTSLEIQEKTHVGGQILVTPAAINCGEVEEFEDFYRCYFQTKGVEGDEIFNQFAINDQAICQTYNTWGSRYYWRKVVGVGEDYIDLSKVDGEYDVDSDAPMAGDKIIQLGNQTDATRQNAIVIAAYGDGSPYIIQYKGINSFEIGDDKIVTKLSSTENIFTGKVHMELGSSISNNIIEDLDERIKDAIGGIAVGKYNLLRNSGFTGDYVSRELDSNESLEMNTEMYSDPFAYWNSNNASPQDSTEAKSGKEVNLQNGSLSQELLDKIILGESYVLSFKAKGSLLEYAIGGVSDTIILNNSWADYVYKFTASEANSIFVISNAQAVICDLQLERGNVQSSWGYSMWDTPKELDRLQSIQYLESAIRQGSTDILGGLIMSNIMMLGNPDKSDNTAGISGIYNDNTDVAYWSGGSFSQAISAVMRYIENPNYQPSEEEMATMANFVVTHGGRAILNEAIVRGDIYANNGRFRGVVEALSGVFNNVNVQTGKIANFNISESHLGIENNIDYEGSLANGMSLYERYIGFTNKEAGYTRSAFVGHNVLPSFGGITALAKFDNTTTESFETIMGTGCGVISNVSGYKDSYAFASEKGVFAGFRPHVAILGSDNSPLQLGKYHHTILALYGGTIVLDGTPENGQEYEIICPNTSVEEGRVQIITYDGVGNIYLMYDGIKRSGFWAHDLGGSRQVIKLVYFAKDNTWFCWHYTY